MHTPRRFFLAFFSIAIGIAVPMTLEPSTAALGVLWVLIALALLGALLTWQPVARRIPYRVVTAVSPRAAADAVLADECDRLAEDMHTWLLTRDLLNTDEERIFGMVLLPEEFGHEFDGRLFDVLDKLATRGYIPRREVQRRTEPNRVPVVSTAEGHVRVLQAWARRLRRT